MRSKREKKREARGRERGNERRGNGDGKRERERGRKITLDLHWKSNIRCKQLHLLLYTGFNLYLKKNPTCNRINTFSLHNGWTCTAFKHNYHLSYQLLAVKSTPTSSALLSASDFSRSSCAICEPSMHDENTTKHANSRWTSDARQPIRLQVLDTLWNLSPLCMHTFFPVFQSAGKNSFPDSRLLQQVWELSTLRYRVVENYSDTLECLVQNGSPDTTPGLSMT